MNSARLNMTDDLAIFFKSYIITLKVFIQLIWNIFSNTFFLKVFTSMKDLKKIELF